MSYSTITVPTTAIQRYYHWTEWLVALSQRNGSPQSDGSNNQYYFIYFYDQGEIHWCRIWFGAVPPDIEAEEGYSQVQNDEDKTDFLIEEPTYNQQISASIAVPGEVRLGDGVLTATVRNTGANDSLNVAIVNAAGDQITTFGGGTEYTVDDAAPATPIGGTMLAQRDDQLSALAAAEGDWAQARTSAKGALWVTIPDSNGDPITSFGGGTQYTEDAPAATPPIGTMAMAVAVATPADVVAAADNVAFRATLKGELYVKQTDTVPVSAAQLPAALVGGRLDGNVGAWLGSTAASVGQKAMASSLPVVIASNQSDVPISAAALPLPTGAATEATLATRLAEATFTTRINTQGQKAMAASTPIVVASDQSAIPISAAALPLPSGAATEATLATRLAEATFTGRINTQGQKAMAASTPIVVASDQSAIPISAAALPLPSGAATEATLATRLAEATFTARVNVLGQNTMANSTPVVIASNQSAVPISAAALPLPSGAATEATLATRLAEATFTTRINTLGQKTMANSTPVTIASDQASIPVSAIVTSLPVDTYSATVVVATTSGDTTVVDPAPGLKVRLHAITALAPQANTAEVLVSVKFGSTTIYTFPLPAGAAFSRFLGAGRRYLDGAANENLIVTLDSIQTVYVNVEYETL